jgi:hypothetical protein
MWRNLAEFASSSFKTPTCFQIRMGTIFFVNHPLIVDVALSAPISLSVIESTSIVIHYPPIPVPF